MKNQPYLRILFSIALLLFYFFGQGNMEMLAKEVPYLSGRVVDEGNILSDATERQLSQILKAHEDSTSNQIVVLTIRELEDEFLEGYTEKVATTWKLGKKDKDNGVLFFVSVLDRKMRIEVGYGLEHALTDARSSRIIRNIVAPHFREGDYDGGIFNGVDAIVGTIDGTYLNDGSGELEGGEMPLMARLIVLGFLFFFIRPFIESALFTEGFASWFMFAFLSPFVSMLGFMGLGNGMGMIVLGVYLIGFVGMKLFFMTPSGKAFRKAYLKRKEERAKMIRQRMGSGRGRRGGGGTIYWGGGSSGGGSFGGGFGGGGFSGGGGSFGGGGASGSW